MVSANIRRGLTFVAVGFLFTLVNVTVNNVNVTPNFVGWLLFFLAYPCLEKHAEGKEYLKWASLIIMIITLVRWVLDITHLVGDTSTLDTIVGIASEIFMFILFGILENVANYYNRADFAGKLRRLKYMNLVFYIVFAVSVIVYSFNQSTLIAGIALISGLIELILAIIICVTLFKLDKEIANGEPVA